MSQTQPQKLRCQSCGVPLDDWFFGTTAEGQETREYCKFCYANGQFTEPELTVDQMIQRNIEFMTVKLKIDDAKSREFSYALIPTLNRWRK
jgi:hypothetical protein